MRSEVLLNRPNFGGAEEHCFGRFKIERLRCHRLMKELAFRSRARAILTLAWFQTCIKRCARPPSDNGGNSIMSSLIENRVTKAARCVPEINDNLRLDER
jgi:hypothetical protein